MVLQLSVLEFKELLNHAAEEHKNKHEPIPEWPPANPDTLESCLNTPFQEFAGVKLYPNLVPKAAILYYLLVKNHALANGNKRMACIAVTRFLLKNGWSLQIPPKEFIKLTLEVAESKSDDKEKMIETIRRYFNHYCRRPKRKMAQRNEVSEKKLRIKK